jgi:hypothetical protein
MTQFALAPVPSPVPESWCILHLPRHLWPSLALTLQRRRLVARWPVSFVPLADSIRFGGVRSVIAGPQGVSREDLRDGIVCVGARLICASVVLSGYSNRSAQQSLRVSWRTALLGSSPIIYLRSDCSACLSETQANKIDSGLLHKGQYDSRSLSSGRKCLRGWTGSNIKNQCSTQDAAGQVSVCCGGTVVRNGVALA